MANAVRYVRATGIHGRFDLELDLNPGVNILYGKNGTGKTTLLHILANILNGDFERFAFLPFETIEVHLDDKQVIKLREYKHSEDSKIDVFIDNKGILSFSVSEIQKKLKSDSPTYEEREPILHTAYFPAFRTLIEASRHENTQTFFLVEVDFIDIGKIFPDYIPISSTELVRRLFGDFVPLLNYPSLEEVSEKFSEEMQKALEAIAKKDRQFLSKMPLDIFSTFSKGSNLNENQLQSILEKISLLLEKTSLLNDLNNDEEIVSKLRDFIFNSEAHLHNQAMYLSVLETYKNFLEERAKPLTIINKYLNSANRFLDGKQLVLRKIHPSQAPVLQVQFHGDKLYSNIQALSSGERQIVTLLYSVTHMSGQRVVLIDEPEISLHIDWQSLLIPEMVAQLQDLQIITCTHSPMIGAEYEDQMIELQIKPTKQGNGDSENISEEVEEDL